LNRYLDTYQQREREEMRYRLHPATVLLYLTAVVFLTLFFKHPFFLLALFFAVGLVILSFELYKEWMAYLKIGFSFMLVIMLINVFFVRAGSTVLYLGPVLPVFGRIRITFEAVCFGTVMGLKLLIIISAFCLFMYVVHPDGILRLLGGRSDKTALALGLSLRLFPLMRADFLRITEVQRCRGVNLYERSSWKGVSKTIPVIRVLLLSSLERAFQLAESLQARGYGLGKRSSFSSTEWRLRDRFIEIGLLLGVFLSLFLAWRGQADFSYYPRLQSLESSALVGAVFIGLVFVFPAFLNWGWKKWPTLRSRI